MTGDQWAAAHGDAWQNFLHKKLKKCECVHPATSNSNRAKVLKEEESLAQGEPAKCLVCFAPINMEVRRFPLLRAQVAARAHAARLLAACLVGACLCPCPWWCTPSAGRGRVRAPDTEPCMQTASARPL